MARDRCRYNFFIIFLMTSFFINGQQIITQNPTTQIDSLRKLLNTENEKFNSYIELSQFYSAKNLDSAIYYSETALNFAVQENENIAKAYHNKSLVLLNWNKLNTAKKNIALARDYYYLELDSTAVAFMNLNIGKIYYEKAQLNHALHNFLLAYDFLKTKEPFDKFVEAVGMIGEIYSDLGMIEKSHEFQLLALKLSEKLNSPEMIMASKNRMALLLSKQDKYSEANIYFEEALELGKDNESLIHEVLISYNGMSNVLLKMGKYSESLKCSDKSLEILEFQKFPSETINVYHTIGKSYLGLKSYSKSEEYLLKAYNLIAKTRSNALSLMECNKFLYQLYEEISKPKQALHHYQEFVHIKDSVFGKGVNEKISQLESDRQLTLQNKAYNELELKAENEKLRYESRMKNIITVCAILSAALLCLFLYFFYKNKETKSAAKLQLAQNKFDSLHAQMNPHFIFNVITGVQNYILKAEKYEAYKHLTTFANSIRLIMTNASKSFTSLEDELELIKAYIDLEKVRFRNDFEYKINVDEKLNTSSCLIPTMIVQPIVENAIIHGLSNKEGSGQLSINFSISECEQFMQCVIIDNGIGREAAIKIKESENQEAHLSIAITNTEQRIQLLKKMGYKHSQINIVDLIDENKNPAGTEVVLCLPIKNE